jgi:hypothetical protein
MELFCVAIGMNINMDKSNMLVGEIWEKSNFSRRLFSPFLGTTFMARSNTLVLS